MSLVLTAMLAKDYLKKYANIRERYTGYYDSASDVMRYVDDFSKPNTLRESVWFSCDETIKISFWDALDEKEQKICARRSPCLSTKPGAPMRYF